MNFRTMAVIAALTLFAMAPARAAETEINSGTVLMGNHSGKYTFILLDENGDQHWLAANFIDIAPGDIVEYSGGIEMRDFHSPAMNHTFAEILLVTNIRIARMVDLPGDEVPEAPRDEARPVAPAEQEVQRLSVAELFLNRHDLEGKTVSLQAEVVGYSGKIMGKNWLTLADGTGSAPDNAILAVTLDDAKLGETLTVRGRVQIDAKMGSMHTYKLLLDDAQLFQ